MKSKPPNKKVKVEVTALGPPGTPDNQKGSTPSLSPAGSTTSSTSSLLSIGPPPYVRPTQDVGGAGGSITVKSSGGKLKGAERGGAAAASSNLDKPSSSVSAGGQAASVLPSYPILTHYNLADFPKINACIVGSKGGAGVQSAVGSGVTGVVGPEALINRPIDNLTMEDIDTLQAELETLWSSVSTRIRLLSREQSIIQSTPSATSHHSLALEHFDPQHQEKIATVATLIDHGTRTSVSAAAKLVMASQLPAGNSPVPSPAPSQTGVTPGTTTKRTTAKGERLPKKKLKGEAGKSKKGGDKPAARATQNRSHSVSSDLGGSESPLKHHEAPNQFWDWVETYCREINKDDLDQLSALIEEQEKVPKDLLDIPPLGKHFKDDEEKAKLRARESRVNSAKDHVGPLTQRLVSALVEERVSMYHNHHNLNSPKEDASLATSQEGFFIHRQGLVRALGLDGGPNTPPLETRIRECLVDQGLLLPDDANDPILLNPDDEILAEIKRAQSLYKKLHQYNAEKLAALYNTGRKELENYGQKRELEKADKDVLDAYKAIAACRLKKKLVSKKEKDVATKALETRKKVLQKLATGSNIITNSGGGAGSYAKVAGVAPVDPTGLLRVQV